MTRETLKVRCDPAILRALDPASLRGPITPASIVSALPPIAPAAERYFVRTLADYGVPPRPTSLEEFDTLLFAQRAGYFVTRRYPGADYGPPGKLHLSRPAR